LRVFAAKQGSGFRDLGSAEKLIADSSQLNQKVRSLFNALITGSLKCPPESYLLASQTSVVKGKKAFSPRRGWFKVKGSRCKAKQSLAPSITSFNRKIGLHFFISLS
jgi:hypothetical protein